MVEPVILTAKMPCVYFALAVTLKTLKPLKLNPQTKEQA